MFHSLSVLTDSAEFFVLYNMIIYFYRSKINFGNANPSKYRMTNSRLPNDSD